MNKKCQLLSTEKRIEEINMLLKFKREQIKAYEEEIQILKHTRDSLKKYKRLLK